MNHDNPTRRRIIRTSLGILAGTAAATAASAQDVKVAQNLVQYQNMPKDGNECDKCVNWVAPDSCKIVQGTIHPKGWCVAYAPKEG